ncbi:hypothetical protein [Actinoalloteichus hymeniacidonis]|uniref:Uncharacterized protein n=1 Tax=Actinoalloteichus hymeniacidonis TaxID=340345 RepID=A0AAC9HM15_9PSEU|nr:hypothetical protein [Actinoalloteichus hymeniacidonis]AOS61690.1 hypothetical protein TL08_04300 [Actinoalloteichus hymeniacidonis]MBB5910295.1 hypothetical protein [Actinoalloteichus hymeniacidonis]
MYPLQSLNEQELQQRIGGRLLAATPSGWHRIDLKALMAVAVRDLSLTVLTADGGSVPVAPTPELGEDLALLRQVTYRPEKGAWFSVRFTMDPPAAFRVSYNYTYEPQWVPPVPPEVFATDLLAFPRTAQYVPEWLASRLTQASGAVDPGSTTGTDHDA